MLGGLARLNVVSLDAIKKAIDEEFEGNVAELNKKAVEIAYNSVKEVAEVVA